MELDKENRNQIDVFTFRKQYGSKTIVTFLSEVTRCFKGQKSQNHRFRFVQPCTVFAADGNVLNETCYAAEQNCVGDNVECEAPAGDSTTGTCVCIDGAIEVDGVCCK